MTTERSAQLTSNLPIPPGEILEEELETIGMSQAELAARTGRPAQAINEIIRGRKALTHDTALELEKVLGIPAHIWTNLESQYRLTLAQEEEREHLERQQERLREFPVREMEKRGWIDFHDDPVEKTRALLAFLGFASFDAWEHSWQNPAMGYRVTGKRPITIPSLAVWMRRGEIEANAIKTAPYDEKRFRLAVQNMRSLTTAPAGEMIPAMQEECAAAGVAVAVVQELPKIGANGVAKWLTSSKALIQMNIRYRWHDIFWFSFIHECFHVLRHRLREVYVDGINVDADEEREANTYAENILIPPSHWAEFLEEHDTVSAEDVRSFANDIDIHPGIVVGRMHNDKVVARDRMNELRDRFRWVST